ncbi:hypothetical protein N7478_009149 [Penicillium angulare]|uniref:uncharacterized protein n=1 Tax=Penicillium angulare TaxID=116970 RepID=UPI0025425C18|nr:uncharacterized protein N7478_009149 [Penicillium angulare]KAJ5274024.1 hypothetical protein N7478_009149 [Penicillium angulare]
MMDRKFVLITGGSRGECLAFKVSFRLLQLLINIVTQGIGKSLLSTYLSRPNYTAIAALRDPNTSSSKELETLPCGKNSELILVKLDSSSEDDACAAVKTFVSEHHIQKLDIVVANAGISAYLGKATVTPVHEIFEHFEVNTVTPLLLFQSTNFLLNAASIPKFVIISSGAGSLSGVENLPVENTAYGTSKAGVNFVMRRIHYENPNLIAFSINLGWFQTDLGNHTAIGIGMVVAPVPIQDGVNGVIEQIGVPT